MANGEENNNKNMEKKYTECNFLTIWCSAHCSMLGSLPSSRITPPQPAPLPKYRAHPDRLVWISPPGFLWKLTLAQAIMGFSYKKTTPVIMSTAKQKRRSQETFLLHC